MRILGIDPGTGICGFGVIDCPGLKCAQSANLETAQVRSVGIRSHDEDEATNPVTTGVRSVRRTDLARPRLLDCGVITTPPHTPLPDRLLDIYNSLHEIIKQNNPDVASVEKLFFTKNITTGISVAEARGVVLLVARQHNLPIFEYTPNEIKKALTGYGNADKKQVQEMVKLHLKLDKVPKPDDAADALAAAITHSLMIRTLPN